MVGDGATKITVAVAGKRFILPVSVSGAKKSDPVRFAFSVNVTDVNGQVGAARPALFLVLVPVVSGVSAWWLLDEQVRVLQVVGVAIVVGALLTGRGSSVRPVSTVSTAATASR